MSHLSTNVQVWLAALLIVAPIPEVWVKVLLALIMVLVCAFVI